MRTAVVGTIVSVDATAGTFMADAYVLTPPTFTRYPMRVRLFSRDPGVGLS